MAENGWFDPMLLESRLPYPESLVKTPLVVATVVAEHPACKEVTEAGELRLHETQLVLHVVS